MPPANRTSAAATSSISRGFDGSQDPEIAHLLRRAPTFIRCYPRPTYIPRQHSIAPILKSCALRQETTGVEVLIVWTRWWRARATWHTSNTVQGVHIRAHPSPNAIILGNPNGKHQGTRVIGHQTGQKLPVLGEIWC
ncbi:hypothetical protein DFH08DRAFT_818762 [Mycena albidolilacea]|uniref:Uncharacterized protein n=1 Tax=Mycena albidolilacea TaxID=1033008 RepID=A0AAD6ZFV4_9AGAR|nr:hypothetical protein DFH08DRAFT_818762 [Mycena albidolilacea]